MKLKNKFQLFSKSWYFLVVVILFYFILFFVKQESFFLSLNFFGAFFLKIVPIFLFVFVLMTLSNYFITQKFIIKHLREKGIKKWIFVIIGGILSSGPIYMWYPLLAGLRRKGLNYGLIACFLYNRAIKIPLLPLAIIYFSWQYIMILALVMMVVSIMQGILLNKLMEVKK